jgi:hypothetical protein
MEHSCDSPPRLFIDSRHENKIRRMIYADRAALGKASGVSKLSLGRPIKLGFKPDPVRYDHVRDALVYDHRLKIPKF